MHFAMHSVFPYALTNFGQYLLSVCFICRPSILCVSMCVCLFNPASGCHTPMKPVCVYVMQSLFSIENSKYETQVLPVSVVNVLSANLGSNTDKVSDKMFAALQQHRTHLVMMHKGDLHSLKTSLKWSRCWRQRQILRKF